MESFSNFLELELLNVGDYTIKVYTLITIALIIIVTKLLLIVTRRLLNARGKRYKIDEGNTYSLYRIISYIVWVMAIGLLLETIGVKVTVLIAGSAALLVGIGLGLQQTFNDIISGIILISEKSIRINDVLEVDGDVVMIQEIGLRTSKALNTDDISIIIPNSLITTNKVINWSHQSMKNRFRIDVGVAYGSDVDLVIEILEACAAHHQDTYDADHVEARLVNFGNSSLDFQVLFYSMNSFRISKVKSDIRRMINQKFKEHKITIPFPQMDVYLKK